LKLDPGGKSYNGLLTPTTCRSRSFLKKKNRPTTTVRKLADACWGKVTVNVPLQTSTQSSKRMPSRKKKAQLKMGNMILTVARKITRPEPKIKRAGKET